MDAAQLRDIGLRLKRDYGADRVLLFGSAARGVGGEDSDIDLLIVARTEKPFFERIAAVYRLLRGAPLPLSPIVLTPQELEARLARGDLFFAQILAEGIEL